MQPADAPHGWVRVHSRARSRTFAGASARHRGVRSRKRGEPPARAAGRLRGPYQETIRRYGHYCGGERGARSSAVTETAGRGAEDASSVMKAKRSRHSRAAAPIRNDILAALLNSEYKHLRPKLERVHLKLGEIIYRADQRIQHVYFPETAVVAMLDTVEHGGTVEVGIIGHEGMVGINIFLGCQITPDKAIVQVAGDAMRMKSNDLRKELRFGS